MWELGHNNWIKYGWTDKLNTEWVPDDQLFVDYLNNGLPIADIDALSAAHLAIDAIVKTYPAPYTLMCSGGVDSQAMLYAWHTSGHKFNVMSFRYKSVGQFFNEHDLVCLSQISQKFNIPINYVDLDVIHFLEGELPEVARINDCDSPQICTHIKFIEAVPVGTVLFAGNFLTPTRQSVMDYTLLGVHRHSLINEQVRVIPNFFTFTPEIAYSFAWVDEKKINTTIKNSVYLHNGFDIFIPEATYTGFEKIKNYYNSFRNRIDTFTWLKYSSKPSHRVFDVLFRYPYEGSGLCKSRHKPVGLIKKEK